jgi:hypothetical protein
MCASTIEGYVFLHAYVLKNCDNLIRVLRIHDAFTFDKNRKKAMQLYIVRFYTLP